jgi:serine/threonine-protein kinase
MNKNKKLKVPQGTTCGKWSFDKRLGKGGNGEVWLAKYDGQTCAIKVLSKVAEKAYSRFRDEIKVLKENSDVTGIVPLLEAELPELGKGTPWYAMPVATPASDVLVDKGIPDVVSAIAEIAETLKVLHSRNITHRDIKPQNLLFLDGKACLSDFGLVDYPDKPDVTAKNEDIGPRWTMAPEMRRNASNADFKKADIYSLGKTLWILLTKQTKGFDGQYSAASSVGIRTYLGQKFTAPLDNLLSISTDNAPNRRPTISEFLNALREWQQLSRDQWAQDNVEMEMLQSRLFPATTPSRAIWEDIDAIVTVLNIVGSIPNFSHIFFPDGGGLDLHSVRKSHERGCIEINTGLTEILKPKRLVFEYFADEAHWNYFRLEADELAPSGAYEEPPHYCREELVELPNGLYIDRVAWDANEYQGEPLPDDARLVCRYVRGTFVIFLKSSIYNYASATYDGRHAKMSTDEFRQYIQRSVDHACTKREKEAAEQRRITRTQTISDHVKAIIALSKNALAERTRTREEFNKKRGDDSPIYTIIEMFEMDILPRPAWDELAKYLQDLNETMLRKLVGLVYMGREEINDFSYFETIVNGMSKEQCLSKLIGKIDIPEYLLAATEMLGDEMDKIGCSSG